MKISKKSWHYRLQNIRLYPWQIPTDLCGYVRSLAFTLILCILLVIVSPVLVPLSLIGYGLFLLVNKAADKYGNWAERKENLKLKQALKPKETSPSSMSLFRQWLKAKKDKMCPLIKWED